MKIDHTPCYILHKRDYKESSLLLEIFSREYGRLSLIAKGAKRNSQRKGIDYSLYQKYKISWVAKSELGTLTDIEYANEPGYLTPAKLMSGFYLNEITMRLLHKHESHPELFDAYDKTIISLANDISEHIVLRYFEKSLLDSLGY
ncbi:MAG: DNA repair protein RecO, partial [Proteobacteria bacterium]|nr:DNA repair protein RecO [Pseudomonadota bacterium]